MFRGPVLKGGRIWVIWNLDFKNRREVPTWKPNKSLNFGFLEKNFFFQKTLKVESFTVNHKWMKVSCNFHLKSFSSPKIKFKVFFGFCIFSNTKIDSSQYPRKRKEKLFSGILGSSLMKACLKWLWMGTKEKWGRYREKEKILEGIV